MSQIIFRSWVNLLGLPIGNWKTYVHMSKSEDKMGKLAGLEFQLWIEGMRKLRKKGFTKRKIIIYGNEGRAKNE